MILGISAFYHDSAACIIKDGKILVAASEERFTRIKNDKSFPKNAINYCLNSLNLNINDLEKIVFYETEIIKLDRILVTIHNNIPLSIIQFCTAFKSFLFNNLFIQQKLEKELGVKKDIYYTTHHLSHAASAFYPSNFSKAAILTIDGVGEWQTTTIGYGEGNKITIDEEINYPNSLGLLYSAFTYFTGFKVNSGEYKMMGLAPYGKPKYSELILKKLVHLNKDGSIVLNQKYFSYNYSLKMINHKFNKLFNLKPRKKHQKITQEYCDIAASIQDVTNRIILKMCNYVSHKYKTKNICLAGGVALNVVAMGYLEEKGYNIWIQPAANDSGGSIGCALYYYYHVLNNKRTVSKDDKMNNAYLGFNILDNDLNDDLILKKLNAKYKKLNQEQLAKEVAKLLSENKCVAIARNRAEFGPRALGNRCILASAINEDTQKKLNLKVKKRESFRPFAPIVLESDANLYFENIKQSKYMLKTYKVKKELLLKTEDTKDIITKVNQNRSIIPAVTHIDNTARVQTINKQQNEFIYQILTNYKKLTNHSVLVNTSFNVRGEPIVNDVKDAFYCFMSTDIDYLVIGNRLLKKQDQIAKIKQRKFKDD